MISNLHQKSAANLSYNLRNSTYLSQGTKFISSQCRELESLEFHLDSFTCSYFRLSAIMQLEVLFICSKGLRKCCLYCSIGFYFPKGCLVLVIQTWPRVIEGVDFRSSYIDIWYTKMILRPSPTLWGWLLTSVADDAGTRHVDVSLATLLCLRNTSNALQNAFYAPTKFTKYANLLNTSSTNTFFKETILLILQKWTCGKSGQVLGFYFIEVETY